MVRPASQVTLGARTPAPDTAQPEQEGHHRRVTPEYLLGLMTRTRRRGPIDIPPEARGTVAAIFRAAQGSAGNQAIADLLADLPPARPVLAERPLPAREASRDALGRRLPDPDRPVPADPASAAKEPDAEDSAKGTRPPPHHLADGAPDLAPGPGREEDGIAQPFAARRVGGAPAPSGGPVVTPDSAAPEAVMASATATATAMPHPPRSNAPPAPAGRPLASRAAAARRIAGPPPVPTVEPSFAHLPDPIAASTRRIEEIGNRLLPDQVLPAVEASPGGHMPIVADAAHPIGVTDRRLILLGESAMDRARLTRVGDPPGPGERRGGDDRARLLALRDQLLAPPAPANAGAPPAPITPPPITVTTPPMPEPDVTLAEQRLFAAVLARTMADPVAASRRVLHDVKQDMPEYPGGKLNDTTEQALVDLGADQLPQVQARLTDRVNSAAAIMGAAGAVLDRAVAARRDEMAAALADSTAATNTAATDAASNATAHAQVRLNDAAAARNAGAEARRRAAAAPRAPKPGFRQIAEGSVARIQAKVSEAIARFRLQKDERLRELDAARDRIIAAYELAVSADELSAQQANGIAPDQTPPGNPLALAGARRRVSAAINRAREWKDARVRTLRTEVDRMKADARTTCDANVTAVEDAGAQAYRDLRAWGATQDGAAEDWWSTTTANLDRWALAAHDVANTWAETEARLARLQMQRDVAAMRVQFEGQVAENAKAAAGYQHQTEGQKRDFVANTILADHGSRLDQLSASFTAREVAAERDDLSKIVDRQLHALPRGQWKAVEVAAKAKNPDFSALDRANTIIKAGVDKIGTDEDAIYEALEGLRPIELEAVTKCYNELRDGDNALYEDLDSEMSGDEWRRAKALMAGDPVAAAVEAIHNAVWGPGTNEAQLMAALRSIDTLPEEQRSAARTRLNELYQANYDESLDDALSGDLSGSELGQARALARGKTDEAEAFEMDYALSGGMTPDASASAAVYDRIRSESMAQAKANNWTQAEFEAEVARRQSALDARFQEHFAGETAYSWGSGSALENAVSYRFALDPGNRDMLQGYQSGDMDLVDAGRMQAEREGIYADDEVMGGVVRAQFTRGMEQAQLDYGPEEAAAVTAQLREEKEARRAANRPPMTGEEEKNRRMELQRESDARLTDHAFDLSHASTDRLNARLVDRYGISLDDMLTQTMSDNVFGQGGALSDARARVEIMRRDASTPGARTDRRLDWAYQRVRFGIEGIGTDMGELRGGLEGLTADEMKELDRRWRRDHDNESLVDAVHGDTSGREEGDLVDLVEHGTPTTIQQRVDELRRRRDRDVEGAGILGARASRDEAARTDASLRELEATLADLRNPNLPPEQRAFLMDAFDRRADHVRLNIEAQRAAIDSFADTVTTILQYVVGAIALVAGVIAGIVTGGAAVPALIAIAGSVIGTLSSMATKRLIKGSAYGAEDIATDAVVGAVDLVVTAASVGAFKGSSLWAKEGGQTIISAAREGMRTAGRTTLRASLSAARGPLLGAAERAVEGGLKPTLTQRALAAGKQFALNQARDLAWSIPTVVASTMMNEATWRHGNMFGNLARGVGEGALDNLRNNLVMGSVGGLVHAGGEHFIHAERTPLTAIEARARDYRFFQAEHPGASKAEFVAHMEEQAAVESTRSDAVRQATREARTELLSNVPPAERAGIADVPILHVPEEQFRTLNGGNYGDAMVFVHEGQAVILVREGAPAQSLRGLASDVREIVAPGTAGRTVNPKDSLPPRLRNRIEVEVVRSPGFGLDEVRAVPQRDAQGRITGVTLEVGPNARAADIQNHVATVDAMRRYAGLMGETRLLLHDVARAAGMDLVSPREGGRWEASLEVAKLPRIIEERMLRLSEHGLDPRRRALVEHEIDTLRAQLASERERLARGAAAEERGYVAAKSGKKVPRSAAPEVDPARAAEHAEMRRRAAAIIDEIRHHQDVVVKAEEELAALQPAGFTEHNNAINNRKGKFVEALKDLRGELPAPLRDAIGRINATSPNHELMALQEALNASPEFREALSRRRPNERARTTIEGIGAHLDALNEQVSRRSEIENRRAAAQQEIAHLNKQFAAEGGHVFNDVPLDARLGLPQAGLGYTAEEGFRRKIDDQLGVKKGKELFEAIVDSLKGDQETFDHLISPGERVRFAPMTEADIRLLRTQMGAHRNGFIAELNLANRVAAIPGETVVHYGHPSGRKFADIVSVDAHGNVTMWDSKFRGEGGTSPHSDTFTDTNKLGPAMMDAIRAIRDNPNGLTSEQVRTAIANIEAGNFKAITSHTNGGTEFRDRVIVSRNGTQVRN